MNQNVVLRVTYFFAQLMKLRVNQNDEIHVTYLFANHWSKRKIKFEVQLHSLGSTENFEKIIGKVECDSLLPQSI